VSPRRRAAQHRYSDSRQLAASADDEAPAWRRFLVPGVAVACALLVVGLYAAFSGRRRSAAPRDGAQRAGRDDPAAFSRASQRREGATVFRRRQSWAGRRSCCTAVRPGAQHGPRRRAEEGKALKSRTKKVDRRRREHRAKPASF